MAGLGLIKVQGAVHLSLACVISLPIDLLATRSHERHHEHGIFTTNTPHWHLTDARTLQEAAQQTNE